MNDPDIPALSPDVKLHFDRVRDTWVLLAPDRAVTLDATGYAILSRVDGKRTFGQIVDALEGTYTAPLEQITSDTAGFLGVLRDRRFLTVGS